MPLTMLYFAWVREMVGVGEEQVEPPGDIERVDALIGWLGERSSGHAAAFADRSRLRVAVDQALVGMEASIAGVREVAIFPPVTGG